MDGNKECPACQTIRGLKVRSRDRENPLCPDCSSNTSVRTNWDLYRIMENLYNWECFGRWFVPVFMSAMGIATLLMPGNGIGNFISVVFGLAIWTFGRRLSRKNGVSRETIRRDMESARQALFVSKLRGPED